MPFMPLSRAEALVESWRVACSLRLKGYCANLAPRRAFSQTAEGARVPTRSGLGEPGSVSSNRCRGRRVYRDSGQELCEAAEGAPLSTHVEIVRIPYYSVLRKYVVTAEPLSGQPGAPVPSARGGQYGWGLRGLGRWGTHPAPVAYTPPAAGLNDRVSARIAAPLMSALGDAGNVVVLDYQHYVENKGNP